MTQHKTSGVLIRQYEPDEGACVQALARFLGIPLPPACASGVAQAPIIPAGPHSVQARRRRVTTRQKGAGNAPKG